MSVSSTSHSSSAARALTSLLQSQPKPGAKKADNDADDLPAPKAAAPKLATSGPGQVLDRKV